MVDKPDRPAGPPSTGLIVLGMHRSGTSALTGAVGLCGAWLGEDVELTAANFENPKGFWERRDIRSMCDRLLYAAGADWWKVAAFEKSAVPHATIAEEGRAFGQVVAKLEAHGTWAIKEPRLCLLLPILRPFVFSPVCIHVYRNPLDVAESLRTRNGFGLAEGLALWEVYNRNALRASAGLPRISVSYEMLISDPEETLAVLIRDLSSLGVTDLALPSTEVIEAFIAPSLRHHGTSKAGTADFLSPSQRSLWSQLQSGEALNAESSDVPSAVVRQNLRDLESRKNSIDQLTEKAKSSKAETKKLASVLRAQEARSSKLEAECKRLATRLQAQERRATGLEKSLTERSAKAMEVAGELKAEKARAEAITAKLEASDARLCLLKDTAASRATEFDKLGRYAKTLERRITTLESRLGAVYASHSWRLTAPLRAVSRFSKWTFRNIRRALELLWWLATGQFARAAAALLPRYQRYVPSRLKKIIPRKVRQAAKKRLKVEPANQPSAAPSREVGPSDRDANAPAPNVGIGSVLGAKAARARFGQELQQILDQGCSPGVVNALRKSESELAQIAARLQSLTDRPLVSIIMPTYNRAEIIGGAIATVLEQEYPNWELLVCDDGSTDDTEAIIDEYFDNRIRYIKLPKWGAAAARNAGLRAARGKFVAYLDSDNFWHPAFLSAIVLAFLENSGRSATYTDFIDFHVDRQGRRKVKSTRCSPFEHERLLKKPYIDLNSFAHSYELYECFGGFNEKLTRRQDYDLILKYTWLRDPLRVPCFATLYQRNDGLKQITTVRQKDRSCISIIEESVAGYFKDGLPLVGCRPVEKVTILSWDLCRNHFSKPFALAEALSTQYDVQLISFRFFAEEIFPPLEGVVPTFETLYLPGKQFPDFFEPMRRALEAIRGDVIYVVKPRLPSLGLALLANCRHGTPIILEINDLETVVSSPKERSSHSEVGLDSVTLGGQELLNPYSDLWSQLMHPLARQIPVLLTHNGAIDEEFSRRCLYMRNLKDERVYDPAAYDRDAIRADLGFEPEDRVILFGGLIRKHKGVYELVELVERLNDPRYKLLFAGSRATPDQKKLKERYGERIRILPPQDRGAMARINCAADLVVLWLDPDVPASRYQMPYKATDAFAVGPTVIANDISDLGLLGKQGYLHVVPFGDWEEMTRVIQNIFDNPDETAAKREACRRLFLRQFSYPAARSNFQLAARRALAQRSGVLPVAEAFSRRFNEFHRKVAHTGRDFIQIEEEANRRDVRAVPGVEGYGKAGEDDFIVVANVADVAQLSHEDVAGVAVVMPSIDTEKALNTARVLVRRAGMKTTVFVMHDTLRQGFIKTLNDTAQRLKVAYLVYLAEDAFPGVDWLRIGYQTLEETGKSLLAFNDGKWHGRIASFGMVRTQWAREIYGGPVLFPGYRAHKADNELTVIARLMDDFVYEATATLVELDASKAFEGGEGPDGSKQAADRNLLYKRFHGGFDARFQWRDVAPYKDEYLNLRKLRVESGDLYESAEGAIRLLDVRSIGSLSWHNPEGIAVIMPCIDPAKGHATAQLLVQRAGIAAQVYVVEDSLRQGFIRTLNDTAVQLDVKYLVYLAEDAFPGENWLRTAHARMEETGKGLLAFNCGKWHGRVAAFGMVRKDWVQQMYGTGVILHPAYKAHKADNELTVIARVRQQFVYEADSILIENDPNKVFKENIPEDKATFHRRFRAGFDGLAAFEHLKPLAESYFVPLESESESTQEGAGSGSFNTGASDSADEEAVVSRALRETLQSFDGPSSSDKPLDSEPACASSATMTNLRAHTLEHEKRQASDPVLSGVLDTLRTLAGEALERRPFSVTDKTTLPPSGDRRDYWHPAPYWWPDPKTPDGLPYVRKDGERAPGTTMYDLDSDKYDRTRLQRVFDDSLILGLAWSFFGERRYAEAGARILERFFADPDTAMQPHLEYAQVRMGHDDNRGAPTGLIEAKDMYFYLDAVRLFRDADVLTAGVSRAFRNWLGTYLEWMLCSPQGKAECTASNNHGTCYDLQVGAIASFLGEKEIVYETLARARERVAVQFTPDGRQPEEIRRRTTAHYCCFNLQNWINLAELSSRWGVDLWEYATPPGAGLKSAAQWLISHMHGPWPYEQIDRFDTDRFLPIWFAASEHLDISGGSDSLPPRAYAVKPVFFPHDGVRPFWNLASYGALEAPRQAQQRPAAAAGLSGTRQTQEPGAG